MFQDNLKAGKFLEDFSGFGPEFSRTLRLVEEESRIEKLAQQKPRKFEESEKSQKSIKSMIVSDKNETKPKKEAKKSVKIAEENIPEPVTEAESVNDLDEQTRLENLRKLSQKKKSPKSPNPKSPKSGKKSTTWDPVLYGGKLSKEQMNSLDRTVGKPSESEDVDIHFNQYVPDQNLVGRSAQLEDVEYEEDDDEEVLRSSAGGKSGGSMFSMFSNLVGNKALTRDDLEPVLAKLRDNLIAKNVASEVAASLIESVMVKLEGSVMGTFQSIARTVKDALTQSLMKLLTPKRRIDILRDVLEAKENKKPYVITFCGVNGVSYNRSYQIVIELALQVGKSTNLAKICFWLIENKFNVLIAACDTFRAGAVEQLRTHTRRLNSLHPAENNKGRQMVQLYEKGWS